MFDAHYASSTIFRRDAHSPQRIGGLLTGVACEASCTHEIATEFRAAMERAIRDYVAEIEMSGGGTVGTA